MAQITDRLDSRHRQAQPGESNECEKKKERKKKSSNIQEQIVLHSS